MTALIDLLPGTDLHRRIRGIVARWAYSSSVDGPDATTARILADPEIAAALAAVPVLERLRQQHQPRRWSPDSSATSCTCGASGCTVADALGTDR